MKEDIGFIIYMLIGMGTGVCMVAYSVCAIREWVKTTRGYRFIDDLVMLVLVLCLSLILVLVPLWALLTQYS